MSGVKGPAVFLFGISLRVVLFFGRLADALDTSALYYNAKAVCSSTSSAIPNRLVLWVFSSSGPAVQTTHLSLTGVNGATHTFSHATTSQGDMVCDLANEGGGIVDASMPHSAMVNRIRTCGQVLSLRSLDTADPTSVVTCYRTNTENPPSGNPTDTTNTEFWAIGDSYEQPDNVFWKWPDALGGLSTEFIAAYFLVAFVFDGVVPGTYKLGPSYLSSQDDVQIGWSTPLTGCLYGSDWFINNPDQQLSGFATFYFSDRIAGPCSLGMNSITQQMPITEENTLNWWFDLPASGGGDDCTTAPAVNNGYAGTLETSFCEAVPDGFVCPVICNTGFTKVGQLRCVDGAWTSDFACVPDGTACPLPSGANVAGIAGLGSPSGIYLASGELCDFSSLDGAVCRFSCSAANSWGAGRLRCDSGTWVKEDADANCLDIALDSVPSGPTFDSIENIGDGMVRLHWTPPIQDAMAQSAIIRYDVTVIPTGELNCPSLYASEPQSTGFHCTGGDAAVMTKYVLQVAAVNSAGVGAQSNALQLTCPALVAITDAQKFDVSECIDVAHDGTCMVRCSRDFAGTPEEWTCSGELTGVWPSCRRLVGCDAPTGIALAATPACIEGAVIADGGFTAEEDLGGDCTPACISGYYSPTAELDCFDGFLSPDTFTCKESCQPPNNDNGLAITCAAGGTCTVSCDPGYEASTASFSCEDEPQVADGLSCVAIPCPVPDVVNVADPPCDGLAPGATMVDAGATCVPQCIQGYYPSQSSVQCLMGSLTPVFECLEMPCYALTGIANQALPSCEEGDFVESGGSCTPLCAAGYEPSESILNCSLGSFDPSHFSCIPLGCSAPSVVNADPGGVCAQSTIAHGENCTAQCAEAYFPSDANLSCELGQLTPATFTCIGDPCPAPLGIVNSAEPSCEQGDEVDSGTNCTCSCASGYVPDRETLSCSLGKMTPPFFACLPAPCSSPEFPNAADVSCEEGDALEHGEVCTLVCKQGYTPSVDAVTCNLGGYAPTDFRCEPNPCPAPTDVDLAPAVTCAEGLSIDNGTSCTTVCDAGYAPNISTLECNAAELHPPTFSCLPAPCVSPTVVNAPEDSCIGGAVADSGTCTTQCNEGYYPSVSTLDCSMGDLSPATFECLSLPCDAPDSVANALSPSCTLGVSIPSGGECATQCNVGYTSTVPILTCDSGSLSPATFSCTPNNCSVPSDIEFAMPQACAEDALEIAHGGTCTAQCQGPRYEPDEATLSCAVGELSPATFSCIPASCGPPTGIENAADPACIGGRVANGSTCTTVCASGWTPTVSELQCAFGELDGSFSCEPSACPVPVVRGSADPCAEAAPGSEIGHGEICTPQCDAGYTQSEVVLTCEFGAFTPATTFICTKELYGYTELDIAGATTAMVRDATVAMVIDEINGLQVSADGHSVSFGPNAWRINFTVVASAAGMDDIVTALELLVGSGTGAIATKLSPFLVAEGWDDATYGNAMSVTAFVFEGIEAATPKPTPPPTPSPTTADHPTLSPTFPPGDCPLPDVENAMSPVCAEGGTMYNGDTCTPRCDAFHEPSASSLSCVTDTMVPATFTCDPIACDVPSVGNATRACGVGAGGSAITSIAHDGMCETRCNTGFAPSAESLSCTYGTLTPETFTCVAVPCSLPDMGSGTSEPPCPEAYLSGDGQTYVIDHGVTCHVECISGYAPSEAELTCEGGVLTPDTSRCAPAGCSISAANSADPPCIGRSSSVLHGEVCTAACQPGYAPTEESLQCTYGVLVPSSFECELLQCAVPVVDNALSPTCEGFDEATTEYLGTCVTQCQEGYEASTAEIICTEGVASPSDTYTCAPKACQVPALDTIANSASRACDENWQGGVIPHSAFCTPLCPSVDGKQLIPTVELMQCVLGELSPASSFDCYLGHCDIRIDITNAASPPCVGVSAGPLQAGETCTAQCLDGFRPTAIALTCNMGGEYSTSSGYLVDGFFDCYEVVDGAFYMLVDEDFGNVSSDDFVDQVKESLVVTLGINSQEVDAFTVDNLVRRRLNEASHQVRGSGDSDHLQDIDGGVAPRRLAVYELRVFYDILVANPTSVSASQIRNAIASLFDANSDDFSTFSDNVNRLSEVIVVDIAESQQGLVAQGPADSLDQQGTDAAGLGGGGSGNAAAYIGGIGALVIIVAIVVLSQSGFLSHLGADSHDENKQASTGSKKKTHKSKVDKIAHGETGDDDEDYEEADVHGPMYCQKALPPKQEQEAVLKASKPSDFTSSQRSIASMKTTANSINPSSSLFSTGMAEDGMAVSRGDMGGVGSTGGFFGDDLDYPESPGFKMLSEFLHAHQNGRQVSKAPSVVSDATNWNDDITKMQDKIWPREGHISVAIYPDGKVQTSGNALASGAVSPSCSQAPSARDGFWAIPGTPDPITDPFNPPAAVFSVPAPTVVTMPTVSSRAPTAEGRSRSLMGTSLTSDGTNWGTTGAFSTSPGGSGTYPPALAAPTPNLANSPCASILGASVKLPSANVLSPPRPTDTSLMNSGYSWGRNSPTPTLQPPLSPAPSTPMGMPRELGSASPSTVTFGAGLGNSGAGPGSFGTAGFGDPMASSQAFGSGFHPGPANFGATGFGATGAFSSAPLGPGFGQTLSGAAVGGCVGGCGCGALTSGFNPGATSATGFNPGTSAGFPSSTAGFCGSTSSLGGLPSATSTGFSSGSGSYGSFGGDFGTSKGFASTSGFDFASPKSNVGVDFGNISGVYNSGGRYGGGAQSFVPPQQTASSFQPAYHPYATVSGANSERGMGGPGAPNLFGAELPGSVPSDGSQKEDSYPSRNGGRHSWLVRDDYDDDDGI